MIPSPCFSRLDLPSGLCGNSQSAAFFCAALRIIPLNLPNFDNGTFPITISLAFLFLSLDRLSTAHAADNAYVATLADERPNLRLISSAKHTGSCAEGFCQCSECPFRFRGSLHAVSQSRVCVECSFGSAFPYLHGAACPRRRFCMRSTPQEPLGQRLDSLLFQKAY